MYEIGCCILLSLSRAPSDILAGIRLLLLLLLCDGYVNAIGWPYRCFSGPSNHTFVDLETDRQTYRQRQELSSVMKFEEQKNNVEHNTSPLDYNSVVGISLLR
jgi:hypothetical protein